MENLIYILLGIGLLFSLYFIIIKKMNDGKKLIEDGNIFHENGVTVNFLKGTIQIEKTTYKVSQIIEFNPSVIKKRNKSKFILIIKFKVPIDSEKIIYLGGKEKGNNFTQNLKRALIKIDDCPEFVYYTGPLRY